MACSVASGRVAREAGDTSWSSSSEEEWSINEMGGASTSSEDSDSDLPSTSTRTPTGKRARRTQAWKKNVRKQRRNAGKKYVSDTTSNVVSVHERMHRINITVLLHVPSVLCDLVRLVTSAREPARAMARG